ncbi:MAG: PilZ domain-containing protein [Tepidisphaeraceae bacterium]|jgi:hypothetical protein
MLKLSPQQYAGVVESLQSAAASGGSDKRQFSRMDVQAQIKVGIMLDNRVVRCFSALTRDVSATGIGLCQGSKFVPQEHFVASLPCAKRPIAIICSATFCRPLADGIYWLGAQFIAEADQILASEFAKIASIWKSAA